MKKFFGNVFAVVVGNILTFAIIGMLIGILVLFTTVSAFFDSKGPKSGSVLEITLNSPIKESKMDDEVSLFSMGSGESVYYRELLNAIEAAKDDDKIKGISLKVDNFQGGTAQLLEFREALEAFKKSGKFIYAYSHNSNQASYVINSVADTIFQNPLGMLLAQGLSSEVMFFKNMGDKYGVDFQVIRHGAYKSAVEPYLRDDLSEENREQLSVLLNDIWNTYSEKISTSRKISKENWTTIVDSLYAYIPENALKYKLVDKLAHESEYDQFIAQKLGLEIKEDDSFYDQFNKYKIGLEAYASTLKKETHKNKIAVVYASGAIMPGESYNGIQSEVYKQAIRDVKDDENIKAVVLRINSPGGSADASEEILYEIRQLRKLKPVIVSFGDVAASGGYYIAMESDSIFASPVTITGSIGVLGMVPSAQKLVNNIGITTDYVSTNANADFLKTVFKPMTKTGMETMTAMTEGVYKTFVGHVMEGRKMTFEQVDKIGGGRVWSGLAAKEIGLIDTFGGLNDAIAAAAKKAQLDKYMIVDYPYRKGGFEEYMQQFQGVKTEAVLQEQLGKEYYSLYTEMKAMREFQGVQLRMPFAIKIK